MLTMAFSARTLLPTHSSTDTGKSQQTHKQTNDDCGRALGWTNPVSSFTFILHLPSPNFSFFPHLLLRRCIYRTSRCFTRILPRGCLIFHRRHFRFSPFRLLIIHILFSDFVLQRPIWFYLISLSDLQGRVFQKWNHFIFLQVGVLV